MSSYRIQCSRNGIKNYIRLRWTQIDSQKIILHPKKKDIHRWHLLPFSRHFVFLSGLRTFFLMIVCLLGRIHYRVALAHWPWTWFTWKKKKPSSSSIAKFFLLRAWIELASLCVTPRASIRGNRESRVQFTHGEGKLLAMLDELGFFFFQVKHVHGPCASTTR